MGCVIIILIAFGIALGMALVGSHIKGHMDAESLYKVASSLVIACIIASTFSLLAVYLALPSVGKYNSTAAETIVEILGILIAVLMGWNIISVVDFQKKADELVKVKDDLKQVSSSTMQLYIKSFAPKDWSTLILALDNCFTALEQMSHCKLEDLKSTSINELLELISSITREMKGHGSVMIKEGKRQEYLYILEHIDNKQVCEIKKDIENAKEEKNKYSFSNLSVNDFQQDEN